jgi:hypothetical protein
MIRSTPASTWLSSQIRKFGNCRRRNLRGLEHQAAVFHVRPGPAGGVVGPFGVALARTRKGDPANIVRACRM